MESRNDGAAGPLLDNEIPVTRVSSLLAHPRDLRETLRVVYDISSGFGRGPVN